MQTIKKFCYVIPHKVKSFSPFVLSYVSHVTISEPGILEVQVRLRMLAWFFLAAALSSLFHSGGGGGGGGGGFQDERVGRVRNVSRRTHTSKKCDLLRWSDRHLPSPAN